MPSDAAADDDEVVVVLAAAGGGGGDGRGGAGSDAVFFGSFFFRKRCCFCVSFLIPIPMLLFLFRGQIHTRATLLDRHSKERESGGTEKEKKARKGKRKNKNKRRSRKKGGKQRPALLLPLGAFRAARSLGIFSLALTLHAPSFSSDRSLRGSPRSRSLLVAAWCSTESEMARPAPLSKGEAKDSRRRKKGKKANEIISTFFLFFSFIAIAGSLPLASS